MKREQIGQLCARSVPMAIPTVWQCILLPTGMLCMCTCMSMCVHILCMCPKPDGWGCVATQGALCRLCPHTLFPHTLPFTSIRGAFRFDGGYGSVRRFHFSILAFSCEIQLLLAELSWRLCLGGNVTLSIQR